MTGASNRERMLDFLDVLYSGDVEGALARCTDDVEALANAPDAALQAGLFKVPRVIG